MKRGWIRAAVRKQIVPGEQLAGLWLDRLSDHPEPGRSAVLGRVQIDHRGPGSLSGLGGVDVEVGAARLERVGVRFELLPRRIALALKRLAGLEGEAEQVRDFAIDLGDDRIAPVEVAGLAGPEIGDSDVVGDLPRPAVPVDALDQRRAARSVEKAAEDEQFEVARRNALDSRSRSQQRGRPARLRE